MQARAVAPAMARARARAAAIPAAAVLDQVRAAAKARAMRAVGRALPAARPAAAEVTASRDNQLKYRPKRYLTDAARQVRLCSAPAKPDLKSDFTAARPLHGSYTRENPVCTNQMALWRVAGKSSRYQCRPPRFVTHLKLLARASRFAAPLAGPAPPWPPTVPSADDTARACLNSPASGNASGGRWHVVARARCPDLVAFQMRARRIGKGALFLHPLFPLPRSGERHQPVQPARKNSSREQIKAAAARPAPAAGPKPTPSRLYPGAELLAGQYRRCAGFASFDALQRQALPAFQTRASTCGLQGT